MRPPRLPAALLMMLSAAILALVLPLAQRRALDAAAGRAAAQIAAVHGHGRGAADGGPRR